MSYAVEMKTLLKSYIDNAYKFRFFRLGIGKSAKEGLACKRTLHTF